MLAAPICLEWSKGCLPVFVVASSSGFTTAVVALVFGGTNFE
jgi:hypothetical protein